MLKLENAIEHFWKLRDPAPDIAGLHAALPQLLVLPEDLTTAAERTQWKRMMSELPLLPKDEVGGKIRAAKGDAGGAGGRMSSLLGGSVPTFVAGSH